MSRLTPIALSVLLLIVSSLACLAGGAPTAVPEVSTSPAPPGPPLDRPTATLAPTSTGVQQDAPSPRTATIAEILNTVQARTAAAVDWGAAAPGQILPTGGEVQTQAEANARLDFSDGTIVRIGAETYFTIAELSGSDFDPVTRLRLAAGELWVILSTTVSGGSFEVETPVGAASVRGSYLEVAYDPQSQSLVASCLEGQCSLRNTLGQIDLAAGQETAIFQPGQPPDLPRPMSPERLERWRLLVREAGPLIEPMRQQLEPFWRDPAFAATAAAVQTRIATAGPQPGALRTLVALTPAPSGAPAVPPLLRTALATLPSLPGGIRP
jgi:hypothetical protein